MLSAYPKQGFPAHFLSQPFSFEVLLFIEVIALSQMEIGTLIVI